MPPNVLLVVLDSVRVQNTSLHGHLNRTTPFLEALADDATWYTQARSAGIASLSSHVSLFTGLEVDEHRIVSDSHTLSPGNTIWEELADEGGYDTGVFSGNPFLAEVPVGLREVFGTVEGRQDIPYPDGLNPRHYVRDHGRNPVGLVRASLTHDRPFRSTLNSGLLALDEFAPGFVSLDPVPSADVYTDLFLDWLDERSGPWAACINYMDAHTPYEPDPEHDEWGGERARTLQTDIDHPYWEFQGGHRPWWQSRALEGLYDGTIRQLDAELERLVAALERRDAYDDTLLVVTADHGEGFGEPSRLRSGMRVVGHGSVDPAEVKTHVPLLVKYPGQASGERVDAPVSLVEFPTVVRATLDGEGDPHTPVTDGPVRVASYGLYEPGLSKAASYCDDVSPFTGIARAAYVREDGQLLKHAVWEDCAVSLALDDPWNAHTVERDARSAVENAFGDLADAGVRTGDGGRDGIDGDTEELLEDLGYA